MFDEAEIRRGLAVRRVRAGSQAWPEIARRLETRPPSRGVARLAVAAVFLLLLAASFFQHETSRRASSVRSRGFEVSRIESRGRPAAAMVLQPDRDTVLVVVSE